MAIARAHYKYFFILLLLLLSSSPWWYFIEDVTLTVGIKKVSVNWHSS